MQICNEDIKRAYSLLSDQRSKAIFINRFMYSMTEDKKFIRNIVKSFGVGKRISRKIEKSKKICIFGAGSVGQRLVKIYDNVTFDFFVDNYEKDKEKCGIPVLAFEEFLTKRKDYDIVISTNKYWKEIYEQLLNYGVEENHIVNLGKEYNILNHRQYFDLYELNKRRVKNEVFIDGGSYDGITTLDFFKWCNSKSAKAYVWEPDETNIKKCISNLKTTEKISYKIIKCGIWDNKAQLRFNSDSTSSAITDSGDTTINVNSIDNLINERVTFIKMDIEGAEYKGIIGAKETIKRDGPKLAVCIYHKPEDIYLLINLIYEINPQYRFYIRHYSFTEVETVLYAV